ncbi:hypothetical protein [Paenibacillus lutimineralis]|uniref:Uncharacterized protein n=1 Tax=Paenibacillus lutimineralis TaxID=2707005 RepID=A0A3Q9I6L1_9BACL|nr:hypothetical protein [Paenibacillus lutimineralis]AZS13823.1 hypothetical protein EI981_04725 [Paenibacillus lutimineralis]
MVIEYVYTGLNGSPIEKYKYKKETITYLELKRPEIPIHRITIQYGVKEMIYYATVETTSGIMFDVRKLSNGELEDDYDYTIIWMDKVSQEITTFVKKEFNEQASVVFKTTSQISITLHEPFQGDRSLRQCFETIEWISSEQRTQTNISFIFDSHSIYISDKEWGSINHWRDLSKYVMEDS